MRRPKTLYDRPVDAIGHEDIEKEQIFGRLQGHPDLNRTDAWNLTEHRDPGFGDTAWFRQHMVYLIERIDVGKHVFIPLNRDYKPIGVVGKRYVKYEDFSDQGMKFARDPARLPGIFCTAEINSNGLGRRLWLYDDDPNSRRDYFSRLSRLVSKAKVFRPESQVLGANPVNRAGSAR